MHPARSKRMKFDKEDPSYSSGYIDKGEPNFSEVIDYSDVFAFSKLLAGLDEGKYGSVTKEYEALHAQRMEVKNMLFASRPSLASPCASRGVDSSQAALALSDKSNQQKRVNPEQHFDRSGSLDVIDLAGLDTGKYGSVTKEYETLHAQGMELKNLLLTLRPSLASPCASPGVNSSQAALALSNKSDQQKKVSSEQNFDSPDVIDLDVDTYMATSVNRHPEKEEKNQVSVIILDSDEEDGGDQSGIRHPYNCELENHDTPAWLESQSEISKRGAKLLAETNSNQLVPYEQGYARLNRDTAVERRIPSIQYEKVVLRNVAEKQAIQYEKVVLKNETEKEAVPHEKMVLLNDTEKQQILNKNSTVGRDEREGEDVHIEVNGKTESALRSPPISYMGMQDWSPGVEVGNEDDSEVSEVDGLEDLWKDMSLAMECSKGAILSDESVVVQRGEECEHSSILEDDLGLVCRICGVIQKSIETIFDFQWTKGTRTRTYMPGSQHSKDVDEDKLNSGPKFDKHNYFSAEISVHPRHMKQMRPHQIEGFNFLVRNLLADKPGGCILAHAPGSGKTFMLISFIQSFLAKIPDARPLVILPKGILATWRKEFQRWQVEDIPLYDFYSVNAINRSQQLDVLKSWQENRSILLLGYKQFANIVVGRITDKIASSCQERLLKVPSLLIMDEGHTPRNEQTDVLTSLGKVQTPCKVVLSGTLFQNHVKEVFNILNLVRPRFLKMESSRPVVKRVLSKVNISGRRPYNGFESSFYDLVEETLLSDDNYKRKITVIQDLRELTQNVLHYYKGDFLEELPGFVDFTVFLNLSPRQKILVKKLRTLKKLKRSSVGNAVYIHPDLKDVSEHAAGDIGSTVNDEKIDKILNTMDARDGVKTKFFLNMLSISAAAGEKTLVFSQYLLPLKFLEKLVIQTKGWRPEKEIFMISGDTSPEQRELSMEQFNNSPDAKIFFGSIKACGEGISLVGASRVLILDVHLNPSVTRQAIGRAFRPGQKKKVYVYRLVASDSPEEEDHKTAFKKEVISKLWFEWSEYSGQCDFELEQLDVANSHDMLLESANLGEDIKALYRR